MNIERAYRSEVSSLPYSSVSVKRLCEDARVSRKVFYSRYKSKDDILLRIFYRDVVAPQLELCRLLTFENLLEYAPITAKRMFTAVHNDRFFYSSLATGMGRQALEWAMTTSFEEFNHFLLGESGFKGSETEQDYIVTLVVSAKTGMLLRWLDEGSVLAPDEITKVFLQVMLPFWKGLIS